MLNFCFALDKEIILFNTEDNLQQDARLARRLPWAQLFIRPQGREENVARRLNTIKDLLIKLLQQNRQDSQAYTQLLKNRIAESQPGGVLHLSNMNLSEIPPEVCGLTYLKELHLEGNNITVIPEAISTLKSLQVLNLNANPIKVLPPGLLKLRNLQVLALNNTDLEELPEQIDN